MNYENNLERVRHFLEESDGDFDDSEGDSEEDAVEERTENTDTEQDASSEDEDELPLSEIARRKKHYDGKDGTKWLKTPPPATRVRASNILRTRLPCLTSFTRNLKSPQECWAYFMNEKMIDMIVCNTNKFISNIRPNYTRERNAADTNSSEIKALLGLLLLCGARKCSRMNMKDLYNSNGSSMEIFRLIMSEFRFHFLLQCIRFDDKNTRDDRQKLDNLAAIREFFDEFVKNCINGYSISAYATVDEMLPAFRGRCSFRQYIPSKPSKYGIKIQALACAKTFYCSKLEVYTGKQPTGPFQISNKAIDVVIRLSTHISGSGRNITTDNYYTSIPLASRLLQEHNLTTIGTLRKNKPEIPAPFRSTKYREVKSTLFGFRKDMTLVSFVPKKKKNVILLSTLHHDASIDSETGKPDIILDYNSTKSGVDVLDRLCSVYNCQRNTKRWPMVIFYTILNVSTINAQIVYEAISEKRVARRKFIESLAFSLFEEQLRYRSTLQNLPKSVYFRIKEMLHLEATEQPESSSANRGIGRCAYCDRKKNRKTRFSCVKCAKHLCLEHAKCICHGCVGTSSMGQHSE